MSAKETATHKIVSEAQGDRFMFFCDVTGTHVCTTKKVYRSDAPEQALPIAWSEEGMHFFNRCHSCDKWVVDAAYNAEVLECVECAPYECEPNFCKSCGAKIEECGVICKFCGKPLIYKGGGAVYDTEDTL